jgi:hypothetical protein
MIRQPSGFRSGYRSDCKPRARLRDGPALVLPEGDARRIPFLGGLAASCSHVTNPRCSAIGRSIVAKRSAKVQTLPSAVCAPRSGRR